MPLWQRPNIKIKSVIQIKTNNEIDYFIDFNIIYFSSRIPNRIIIYYFKIHIIYSIARWKIKFYLFYFTLSRRFDDLTKKICSKQCAINTHGTIVYWTIACWKTIFLNSPFIQNVDKWMFEMHSNWVHEQIIWE